MSVSATYVLECDWNADGDYSDTSEDITADALSIECKRGRDYASQLTGRASAGTLTVRLDNTSKKYSSFNTSSPIYGLILPGRRVRLRTTAPTAATLWTGFLDRIQPESGPGGALFATLTAVGAMNKLQAARAFSAGPHLALDTGTNWNALLNHVDWPAADRTFDVGLTTVTVYFTENSTALDALREMEDTEWGFMYEGLAHDMIFENRTHRLTGAHLTSQATFSDAGGAARPYVAIEQGDPLQDIWNEVVANVQAYDTSGSVAVLWTSSDPSLPVSFAPGQEHTWLAVYNGDGYVNPWTSPVLGTDIITSGVGFGFINLSVTYRARHMEITVINDHPTDILTVTALQARGIANPALDRTVVESNDATSQDSYGLRTYNLPSQWLPSTEVAQDYCDYGVSRYKNPLPILRVTIAANRDATSMAEAVGRAISDRVTIVANGNAGLGINQDFYIEAISHRISEGKMLHMTTFDLSPTSGDAAYWILGTSELGTSTVLGY